MPLNDSEKRELRRLRDRARRACVRDVADDQKERGAEKFQQIQTAYLNKELQTARDIALQLGVDDAAVEQAEQAAKAARPPRKPRPPRAAKAQKPARASKSAGMSENEKKELRRLRDRVRRSLRGLDSRDAPAEQQELLAQKFQQIQAAYLDKKLQTAREIAKELGLDDATVDKAAAATTRLKIKKAARRLIAGGLNQKQQKELRRLRARVKRACARDVADDKKEWAAEKLRQMETAFRDKVLPQAREIAREFAMDDATVDKLAATTARLKIKEAARRLVAGGLDQKEKKELRRLRDRVRRLLRGLDSRDAPDEQKELLAQKFQQIQTAYLDKKLRTAREIAKELGLDDATVDKAAAVKKARPKIKKAARRTIAGGLNQREQKELRRLRARVKRVCARDVDDDKKEWVAEKLRQMEVAFRDKILPQARAIALEVGADDDTVSRTVRLAKRRRTAHRTKPGALSFKEKKELRRLRDRVRRVCLRDVAANKKEWGAEKFRKMQTAFLHKTLQTARDIALELGVDDATVDKALLAATKVRREKSGVDAVEDAEDKDRRRLRDKLRRLRNKVLRVCDPERASAERKEWTLEKLAELDIAHAERSLEKMLAIAAELGVGEGADAPLTAAEKPHYEGSDTMLPSDEELARRREEMTVHRRVPGVYSFTEKKRMRRSFSTFSDNSGIPFLLQLQRRSYSEFLQKTVAPGARADVGLQRAFNAIFPIESSSGLISLEFLDYELNEPIHDMRECKPRGLTYHSQVHARIRMVIKEKKGGDIKLFKDEKVYMGDLPLMTPAGAFIVNGTERVVVSQLHRSPGVIFEHDSGRGSTGGQLLYSARVIPYNGRWLDFEFDKKDLLYFRIDRRRKMLATILLKAIGYTKEEILRRFYEFETFQLGARPGEARYRMEKHFLRNATLPFDVLSARGLELAAKKEQTVPYTGDGLPADALLIARDQRIKKADLQKIAEMEEPLYPVDDSFLLAHRIACPIVKNDGEVLAQANDEISDEMLATLRAAGIREVQILHFNEIDSGPYISQTFDEEKRIFKHIMSRDKSRETIYRMLRPGDPPNADVVNNYLDGVFFSLELYDLSKVGRMKINRRLDSRRPPMEYQVMMRGLLGRSGKGPIAAAAQALVDAACFSDLSEAVEFVEYVQKYGKRAVAVNLREEDADKIFAQLREKVNCFKAQQTTLSRRDIFDIIKKLVDLRNGKEKTDDIDSLANRRVRAVGEFVENYFRQGLMRVERAIRDRLSRAESEGLMPHDLISAKAISGSVSEFFNGNQLSQFMDQTNPLSEITHKRRVSALGAGGLSRDRVGFEVRDVHPTHYGRMCPIETPEGGNIGLICSMSLYSEVNPYGFLQTPYIKVERGRATDRFAHLSAIEEEGKIIAPSTCARDDDGNFLDELVTARQDGDYVLSPPHQVDYMDIAPSQIASVAASLIPFLEHDDANRALMGSNMQRQGVPCLRPEKPLVGTGIEHKVAVDSASVLLAKRGGIISHVDAERVAVRVNRDECGDDEVAVDVYNLSHHVRSNQNTDINQRPIIYAGDAVAAGDVLADGSSTDLGELALGQNLLVAFMPWNGYNFEDSITLSEKVVVDSRFESIHIIEEVLHARGMQLGPEEITRDIPHQSEETIKHLDEEGIVHVGVEVAPGDILVGKVTPKGERQLTPEEKLLRAVFGDKADDVKDTSLRMPPGSSGVVIDVKVFTSDELKKHKKRAEKDAGKRASSILNTELETFRRRQREILKIKEGAAIFRIRQLADGKFSAVEIGGIAVGEQITGVALDSIEGEKWYEKDALRVADDDETNARLRTVCEWFADEKTRQDKETREHEKKQIEGHELPQGILKTVKVYVAIKRNLQVGDKMAGRHGNKGVASKIVPLESMPYLADGTPVDIVLNPLGVPSRMNVGQVLETHLGFAAKGLGDKIKLALRGERDKQIASLRRFLGEVYKGDKFHDISKLSDDELIEMAKNLQDGVPFASAIFEGASESQISDMLTLADLPPDGRMTLYDGHSGEPFAHPVTVGYMYIMKLHHLVDEKMHARATGPYSLVTQQPLGGKAQRGGQRFGEMEVWALEAYGAAYTLCEMLTVKSDDIVWRTKMFENITEGDFQLFSGIPESFNVLVQEVRALAIDMSFN